jgi:DNA modification methylase
VPRRAPKRSSPTPPPKVERCTVPVALLRPSPFNPRQIEPAALQGLTRSVADFGLVQEVVANRLADGTLRVVGGHQRLAAAKKLGLREVPVAVVQLDNAHERALLVALNSGKLQGTFTDDLPQLLAELEGELDAEEFAGLRFDDLAGAAAELEAEAAAEQQAEDGPEPDLERDAEQLADVTEPRMVKGQVARLGEHLLACRDSLAAGAVHELLGDATVDCVLTDPPYAIYGSSTGVEREVTDDKIVAPFFANVGTAAAARLKKHGHAYAFCDWRSWGSLWIGFVAAGLTPRNMLVWDKGNGGLGSNYCNSHELVLFAHKLPRQVTAMRSSAERGVRPVTRSNLVRHPRVRGEERLHNAAKPLGMLREFVRLSTNAGDLVLDLFGGSGTALIACEHEKRRCATFEIEPRWCEVTLRRWELATGKKAELMPMPAAAKKRRRGA